MDENRYLQNLKELFGRKKIEEPKIDVAKIKKMIPKENMVSRIPSQVWKEVEKRNFPDYTGVGDRKRNHKKETQQMHKEPEDYKKIAENQLYYLCGDGGGNSWWYSIKDGSIWWFEHDEWDHNKRFHKIANNLREWSKLLDKIGWK